LAVAETLTRHGVTDPVVIQAALLHDTVEDTETTREELEREFGNAVSAVVMEVTDDKSLPKAERKRLQIEHAPGISVAAKLVKLADKICNARDVSENPPADWSVDRRREYLEWTRAVVAGCRGVNDGLERAFDELVDAALSRLT
jgi:guanosine-3',5'-bis(diphosphate) 3'-pyrophosphohydrolase